MRGLHSTLINLHYGQYIAHLLKVKHSILKSFNFYRTDLLVAVNTSLTPSQATPLPPTHIDGSLIYILGDNLVSSRITPWLALSIVRAICCGLSWMIMVWITGHDRLLGTVIVGSCSNRCTAFLEMLY